MKKSKFVICFILLSIVITGFPCFAYAKNVEQKQYFTTEDLSDSLVGFLQKENVLLDSDTIIEIEDSLISKGSDQKMASQAIIITNRVGCTVTKDIIQVMEPESLEMNNQSKIQNSFFVNNRGAADYYDLNGKYIVHGVVTYDTYYDSEWHKAYFRPLSAKFRYTKNSACSVTYIEISYNGFGNIYNVSDYSFSHWGEHYIYVNRNNPVAGIYYETTNPYTLGKAFDFWEGLCGESIYFFVTCDGSSQSYSINI